MVIEVDRRLERKALYFALRNAGSDSLQLVRSTYDLLLEECDRYRGLLDAVETVTSLDWSDNDADAVETIDSLTAAFSSLKGES